uniref:EGF-like domain-containing protein n=1 Tax=Gongylonema pulchrum TaxID=637853 RepID=A0A183EB58_9BILA
LELSVNCLTHANFPGCFAVGVSPNVFPPGSPVVPAHILSLSTALIDATELTDCCKSGRRHFEQMSTCSKLKLTEKDGICIRTAAICCMSTLLNQSCELGIKMANEDEYCPFALNEIGGGLRKECCDCCMLAKELTRKHGNCTPPNGFSETCLRSFHHCCSRKSGGKYSLQDHHHYESHSDAVGVQRIGDRCALANCEHVCTDRGGASVECSCHAGYELGSDGYSCVDIDECDTRETVCTLPNAHCLNTPGSFSCVCLPGFYWSDVGSVCVVITACVVFILDIDECLLLADNCLESQRCLNTPGSFKCIRTLSCGTGYALDSDTEQCIGSFFFFFTSNFNVCKCFFILLLFFALNSFRMSDSDEANL